MYAFQLRESMDFAGKHLNGMMFFFYIISYISLSEYLFKTTFQLL